MVTMYLHAYEEHGLENGTTHKKLIFVLRLKSILKPKWLLNSREKQKFVYNKRQRSICFKILTVI